MQVLTPTMIMKLKCIYKTSQRQVCRGMEGRGGELNDQSHNSSSRFVNQNLQCQNPFKYGKFGMTSVICQTSKKVSL